MGFHMHGSGVDGRSPHGADCPEMTGGARQRGGVSGSRPDWRGWAVVRSLWAGVVLLVLGLVVPGRAAAEPWLPPALVEPGAEQPAPITGATLAAIRAPVPTVTGTNYAAADAASGRLLLGRAERRPRAMASLTKIMTALLALETGRLDDAVAIDVDYRRLGDSSVMGLLPGERLTLEELLYGLLLPSGNDAAMAIARHLAGSEEAFVARMNARAAELGLRQTHFANPHGLDEPGHYSSAEDLLALARVGMANPTFRQIVATRSKVIEGRHTTYTLTNSNQLLGVVAGVDGVKTGTTDNCGQCLLLSATRGGHRALLVVLGSQARWDDGRVLVEYLFGRFRWIEVRPVAGWGATLLTESGRRLANVPEAPLPPLPDWQAALVAGEVWPGPGNTAWLHLSAAGEPLVTPPAR